MYEVCIKYLKKGTVYKYLFETVLIVVGVN